MIKPKKKKSMVLTAGLALGLIVSVPASAYVANYASVNNDSRYKTSQIYDTAVENLLDENELTKESLDIGQGLNAASDAPAPHRGGNLFRNTPQQNASESTANASTAENEAAAPESAGSASEANSAASKLNSKPAASKLTSKPAESESKVTPAKTVSSGTTESDQKTTAASAPAAPPAEETTSSASELDLLARLIMAEAQGEPYDAKVAVGASVLNRVESSSFPNSIKAVIYQNINGYYQFTPVVNGWIDKPANAECVKAAKTALSGVDPTNGTMFYYDNTTTNPWILQKEVSVQFGNMIFAY